MLGTLLHLTTDAASSLAIAGLPAFLAGVAVGMALDGLRRLLAGSDVDARGADEVSRGTSDDPP